MLLCFPIHEFYTGGRKPLLQALLTFFNGREKGPFSIQCHTDPPIILCLIDRVRFTHGSAIGCAHRAPAVATCSGSRPARLKWRHSKAKRHNQCIVPPPSTTSVCPVTR